VASGRALVAALIALYLAATLTAAIKSEEAFLRGRFGDRYDQYRHHGLVDEDRRFSLAQAFRNREHRAVFGLLVVVLMLVLKATYNGLFGRTSTGFVRPGG
jgi:hypothetical protein